MIYGPGMLELGVTFDYAQLFIDNEIARMVNKVVEGIPVTDETLAVDLIKKVGSSGQFITE
jgi:trimethylamine--corrinoid protein Co-methyltransferase